MTKATLPLEGVRVLDLSAWQAGPTATMILADFGAEVIKIEAWKRLDGWRGGAGLTKNRAFERNPLWNGVNRNKYGLSLDLKAREGRDIFLELVNTSDVVLENFTPRVMESLDLGYDVLKAANPKIVYVAMSGFGATGPWRDFSAFAFPTEEMSGLTYFNGDPAGPPRLIGQPVTDALAGTMGAISVLVALEEVAQSGEGQFIDLSQIEALTHVVAGEVIETQITGEEPARPGSRHASMSPHGVFPSVEAARWLVIAVRDNDEWHRLLDVTDLGHSHPTDHLATVSSRKANEDEVERLVASWTAARSASEAAELLQEAGIPAAPVASPADLVADEHLWERGFFETLDREEVGTHPYPGPAVRLSRTPGSLERPAPLFGQHTEQILKELCGLSDEELERLDQSGVTSRVPDAQEWR